MQPQNALVCSTEAVLEQHPKFRAIHSKDSVQKVIEKVGCKGRHPRTRELEWNSLSFDGPYMSAWQVRADKVLDVP